MPDYQKMHTTLFNTFTDVMKAMQNAQCEAEEIYISDDDNLTDESERCQALEEIRKILQDPRNTDGEFERIEKIMAVYDEPGCKIADRHDFG